MENDWINNVEQAWRNRATAQELKPGSAAYRKAEVEFFTGAMATINAIFPSDDPTRLSGKVPVKWVINAMSGRPIVEEP